MLTIKGYSQESVGRDDDNAEKKFALHFEEIDQLLGLNTTNAEIIAGLYGEEVEDWKGNRITLYHNPNIKFGGKKVGGISVRESAPKGGAARTRTPNTGAAGWTLEQALAAAEEVGVAKDDLRKILHDAGHKGWNPGLTQWLQKILADMVPPDDGNEDAGVIEF